MAYDVRIADTEHTAKVRNPWLVLLFSFITLGVYTIFWWYFINREVRDLGRARGTQELGSSPGRSVLAYTLGGVVYIPLVWTIVTTVRRAQKAQRLTGKQTLNGWLAAAFWILTLFFGGWVYLQYELNKVWRRPGMVPADGHSQGEPWPEVPQAARLEKLAELRNANLLTEEQHEAEKQRLGL